MKEFIRFISTPVWWNPFFWLTMCLIICLLGMVAGFTGTMNGIRDAVQMFKSYWKTKNN